MTAVAADLANWYRANARDLPWRRSGVSPWGVLVSEVMLQQTPVNRVLPYWRRWLARWAQPSDLARASPADVIRAWGTLGYPRRGLRLRDCAVAIVDHHDGIVPAELTALRELPGIGRYTAAAVACFAFGQAVVVVDTNIARVLGRVFDAQALPAPSLGAADWARAAEVLPGDPAAAVVWNQATMELGALVCQARQPDCPVCPLGGDCAWRAQDYPGDRYAGRRQPQAYQGTDRQARGRVLALLRQADGETVPVAAIVAGLPRIDQAERAMATLVADGLAVRVGAGLRLPD